MSIKKIFKPEILSSSGYQGGKSAEEVDSSGKKIYKLSSNENVFGSSPKALKVLQEGNLGLNIYPSGTSLSLYKSLKKFYRDQLSIDHFFAGNSGSGLIELITRAFLSSDTNCIISNPCFSPYQMFSSWTGAKVIDIPLLNPSYELDVTGLLSAINPQTRIIFLTSPNNPTGTYIKTAQLKQLLADLPDHIVIIYDEVYFQFVQAEDYSIALPFVLDGHPIIAINSFSKAYGLAGLRIGYGYSTPEITAYLKKLIRPFLINELSMRAAIAALDDQDFINHTVNKVVRNRTILMNGLDELDLEYWPSQANFILVKTNLDEQLLTARMLEHNIMVRPTGNFGAPGCIRITIGAEDATEATLSALASILKN